MGRPKNFSREEVLEKAMPVFWTRRFFDSSLQDLERASGVKKSGLYSEFRDKEDLFVVCLRHYLESQGKRGLLTKEPLGWSNVETFLKNGPLNKGEQQGCFSVNSMREFVILPDEAYGVVTEIGGLLLRYLTQGDLVLIRLRSHRQELLVIVGRCLCLGGSQCGGQTRLLRSKSLESSFSYCLQVVASRTIFILRGEAIHLIGVARLLGILRRGSTVCWLQSVSLET
jgi:TetR/AcrR family transcriptional regulator, copper-responsive repressor